LDYVDNEGKRRFATFDRKKDAEAAKVRIGGEIATGTHTPQSTSITVREAAAIWYERGELEELERGTLRNYRRYIDHHILPAMGRMKLAQLTRPAIESFRDQLLHDGSREMATKVLAALKGILSEAERRGLVAQNVAQAVKVGTKSRDRTRLQVGIDIPSKEDIRTLLDGATGRWRPLIITAVRTGMRASELRGLRWSDVDLEKRVVNVRQRADIWGTMGPPKSFAGKREIPLSKLVVNTLREWRLACPKGPLDLAFPNGAGRVESLSNIYGRGYAPLQRHLGLVDERGKPKYKFHSLRHFCASYLIERGFAPKRIQSWLGHSSITMTFDVYGHLFPSLEDDHAKLDADELELVGG
jgi:integrase